MFNPKFAQIKQSESKQSQKMAVFTAVPPAKDQQSNTTVPPTTKPTSQLRLHV